MDKLQSNRKKEKHLTEDKLDGIMMLLLFGIYPFLACKLEAGSVSIQGIFLFFVIFMALFLHITLKRQFRWKLPKMNNLLGLVAILAGCGAFFSMMRKMFQDNDLGHISFSGEVVLFALLGMYVLTASQKAFQPYYFDFIAYAGILMTGMLLYHFTGASDLDYILGLLVENENAIASYMILIGTVDVLQYCRCRARQKSFFYGAGALLSFFVLFITQNAVGISIMVFVFVAIPILFRPTVELVKRDMQLFFLYLFLLSNMSLIAQYTDIIQKELSYSLQNGVYLELVLAAGGIVFFHFWERIPEGADRERLVLRRMRKGYRFLFRVLAILAVAAVAGGAGGKFADGQNCFQYIYEQSGVYGIVLMVIFLAAATLRMQKNYHPDKPVTIQLMVVSGTFIVQLFFWEPTIQTMPVYLLLMFFALYTKETRRVVVSKKIKIASKEELEKDEKTV